MKRFLCRLIGHTPGDRVAYDPTTLVGIYRCSRCKRRISFVDRKGWRLFKWNIGERS
jgi:hypothetical protein